MSPELQEFITEIAADMDRMTRYLADPEAAMAAANLAECDCEILRRTDPCDLTELLPFVIMQIHVMPPPPEES